MVVFAIRKLCDEHQEMKNALWKANIFWSALQSVQYPLCFSDSKTKPLATFASVTRTVCSGSASIKDLPGARKTCRLWPDFLFDKNVCMRAIRISTSSDTHMQTQKFVCLYAAHANETSQWRFSHLVSLITCATSLTAFWPACQARTKSRNLQTFISEAPSTHSSEVRSITSSADKEMWQPNSTAAEVIHIKFDTATGCLAVQQKKCRLCVLIAFSICVSGSVQRFVVCHPSPRQIVKTICLL